MINQDMLTNWFWHCVWIWKMTCFFVSNEQFGHQILSWNSLVACQSSFKKIFLKDFIYLRQTEREREQAGGVAGKGRRRSSLPAEQGAGWWRVGSQDPWDRDQNWRQASWPVRILKMWWRNIENSSHFLTCIPNIKVKLIITNSVILMIYLNILWGNVGLKFIEHLLCVRQSAG